MNYIQRPITKHHRARLIAWTLSMLLWTFQALCAGMFSRRHQRQRRERQRRERMSLTRLTQQVKLLIISRANDLVGARMRPRQRISYRGCRNVLKPGFVNAILGVRLRRILHRKGLIDRIATLVQALQQIDDYAALVAHRLRRGLTRRCLQLFALPPTPAARLVILVAPDAICVDSS